MTDDRKQFIQGLPCPVCQQTLFAGPGTYEICDVCKWENDPVQAADPDLEGGANQLSLKQARKAYQNSL